MKKKIITLLRWKILLISFASWGKKGTLYFNFGNQKRRELANFYTFTGTRKTSLFRFLFAEKALPYIYKSDKSRREKNQEELKEEDGRQQKKMTKKSKPRRRFFFCTSSRALFSPYDVTNIAIQRQTNSFSMRLYLGPNSHAQNRKRKKKIITLIYFFLT